MMLDRLGQDVRVTTVERTIADLFDRYNLAGHSEELFNSLDLVVRIDVAALVQNARSRGKATAVGSMGFWLEREQKLLGVSDAALTELRTLMPAQPCYALGTKPGAGKTVKGWNVILPVDAIERHFEGL